MASVVFKYSVSHKVENFQRNEHLQSTHNLSFPSQAIQIRYQLRLKAGGGREEDSSVDVNSTQLFKDRKPLKWS
jgi:hypothetical protein